MLQKYWLNLDKLAIHVGIDILLCLIVFRLEGIPTMWEGVILILILIYFGMFVIYPAFDIVLVYYELLQSKKRNHLFIY